MGKIYTVPPRSPASAISRLMTPSLLFAEHHGRKRDADPVETAELQRLDQTDSALNTDSSDEPPIPVAESSGQTLATACPT